MRNDSSQIVGIFILALLGAGFLIVPALAGYSIVRDLTTWTELQQWSEAPAVIIEVNQPPRKRTRLTVKYEYEYSGTVYQGSTLSVYGLIDNDSDLRKRRREQIKGRHASGRSLPCYVNPADPKQSVLYRDLDITSTIVPATMAVFFMGIGGGLLVAAYFGWRNSQRFARCRQRWPDQPWLWNEAWANKLVPSSNKVSMYTTIVLAVYVNWFTLLGLMVLPKALATQGAGALMFLICPLTVGGPVAALAVWQVWRWRKFGQATFRMRHVPGVVGGTLAGVVRTGVKVNAEEGFHVSLICSHRSASGRGSSRSMEWQDHYLTHRDMTAKNPRSTAIPILFEIPFSANPTTMLGPRRYRWQLDVQAELEGLDYSASFSVPIFKTEKSAAGFRLDEKVFSRFGILRGEGGRALEKEVSIDSTFGGKTRFTFPGRVKGMGISLAVGFAIFLLLSLVFLLQGLICLAVPVIGATTALWYALMNVWYWHSVVEVEPHRIRVTYGRLGHEKSKSLRTDEIESIEPKRGVWSTGHVFYNIVLTTTGGKQYTLAKRISGVSRTRQVIRRIEQALEGNAD